MSRPVRWGVLGASSSIATFKMLDVLGSVGELVAVASRDAARAEAIRDRRGARRAYGSYAELLGDDDVDGVYIALPNSMHAEWSMASAAAGKHCLCEKPAFLDVAEALQTAAAVRAAGTRWVEAYMYRYLPHRTWLLDRISEETWGPVRSVRASIGFLLPDRSTVRWSRPLGGGALTDLGCYAVDLVRSVVGRPTTRVVAATWQGDDEVDSRTAALLQFADVIGVVDCDMLAAHHQRVTVECEQAVVSIEPAFNPGPEDVRVVVDWVTGQREEHRFPASDPYTAMVGAFDDARTDDELAAALANATILEAIATEGTAG